MKYIRINFNKLYESSSANDQQIINSAKALIKVFENYRFLYCSFFRDYYDRDGNYKAALCHDTLFNSGDCREITNLIFYPIMDKKDLSQHVDDLSKMNDNRHYIEKYKNFIFNSLDNFEYMPTKSRNLFERTILGRCNKLIYGVFNYYIDKVKTSLNKQFPSENYKSDIDLFAADEQANDDYIKELENTHLGIPAANAAFYKDMYKNWIIDRVNDTMNTAKNKYFLDMRKKSNTENTIDSTDTIDIAKDAINFIVGTLKNAPIEFKNICEKNKEKHSVEGMPIGETPYLYDEKTVRIVAYNYYTFFMNFALSIADAVSSIKSISIPNITETDFEESIIDEMPNISEFVDNAKLVSKIQNYVMTIEKQFITLYNAFSKDLEYACINRTGSSKFSQDDDKDWYSYYNFADWNNKPSLNRSSISISNALKDVSYKSFCELLIILDNELKKSRKSNSNINRYLAVFKKYFDAILLEKKITARLIYEKFEDYIDDNIAYLRPLAWDKSSQIYQAIFFNRSRYDYFIKNYSDVVALFRSNIPSYNDIEKILMIKINDWKQIFNFTDSSLDKYINCAKQNKAFKLK